MNVVYISLHLSYSWETHRKNLNQEIGLICERTRARWTRSNDFTSRPQRWLSFFVIPLSSSETKYERSTTLNRRQLIECAFLGHGNGEAVGQRIFPSFSANSDLYGLNSSYESFDFSSSFIQNFPDQFRDNVLELHFCKCHKLTTYPCNLRNNFI